MRTERIAPGLYMVHHHGWQVELDHHEGRGWRMMAQNFAGTRHAEWFPTKREAKSNAKAELQVQVMRNGQRG